MITQARLRAPLWRRVRAFFRRKLSRHCATCVQYAGHSSGTVLEAFHEAHRMVERLHERIDADIARRKRGRPMESADRDFE